MKKIILFLFFLNLNHIVLKAQNEEYSYFFAHYSFSDNTPFEVVVCKTESFKWVSDKVTGMSNINYVPEANFRKWVTNSFGDNLRGIAFYPAENAEKAINYYKSIVLTYQQSGTPFKNSSYCNSIYTIKYNEPAKKVQPNTIKTNTISSNNNSQESKLSPSSKPSSNNSTSETTSQRQYREQQELVAQLNRQSQAQSKQVVENATELVGLVGNMLATNRADREKKLAKKEEEKMIEKERLEQRRLNYLGIIRDNEEKANEGDTSAMNKIGWSYICLDDYDNARFWYFKSANLKNSNGMIGMAKTLLYSMLSKVKIIRIGRNNNLEDSLKIQIDWLKKAASLGNITAYNYLLSYLKGQIGSDREGEFTFHNADNLYPWSTLKGNKEIINFFKTEASRMQPLAFNFLEYYYFKES